MMKIYHICNLGTPLNKNLINIYNFESLERIKEKENIVFLLNIHLDWENHKLQNNYGFEIANLMRIKLKYLALIVFYSPMEVSYFENLSKKNIVYKILFGRGSIFVEIPIDESNLLKLIKNATPLNKASLHDLVTMLCTMKGLVIDKLNHDLKIDEDIEKIIHHITPYITDIQKQLIGFDEFINTIKQLQKAKNKEQFIQEKNKFIARCNVVLTNENGNKPILKTDHKKYTILILEDDANYLISIEDNLSKFFNIIKTTQGAEALDILNKDYSNKILVVLADWRLYKENSEYWQDIQGYEVLQYAANNGIRALFALTAQSDFVVHQLRNELGIKFWLFKKENLRTSNDWEIIIEIINESCIKMQELIINLPDTPYWNTYYKNLYIEIQNSEDSSLFFAEIDTTCNNYLDFFKNNPTINLKGEFNYSIPKPTSKKGVNLKNVLILRRIWIAVFWLHKEAGLIDEKKLFEKTCETVWVLFTRTQDQADIDNIISQQLNNLGLNKANIINKKMLPEELDWLKNKNIL